VHQKDLRLLLRNCRLIGTLSSTLAGFCFMGTAGHLGQSLSKTTAVRADDGFFLFVLLASAALGCALTSYTVATGVTMFAPGLALRGRRSDSLLLATQHGNRYLSHATRLCAGAVALLVSALLALVPLHSGAHGDDSGTGGGAGGLGGLGAVGGLGTALLVVALSGAGLRSVRADGVRLARTTAPLGSGGGSAGADGAAAATGSHRTGGAAGAVVVAVPRSGGGQGQAGSAAAAATI